VGGKGDFEVASRDLDNTEWQLFVRIFFCSSSSYFIIIIIFVVSMYFLSYVIERHSFALCFCIIYILPGSRAQIRLSFFCLGKTIWFNNWYSENSVPSLIYDFSKLNHTEKNKSSSFEPCYWICMTYIKFNVPLF